MRMSHRAMQTSRYSPRHAMLNCMRAVMRVRTCPYTPTYGRPKATPACTRMITPTSDAHGHTHVCISGRRTIVMARQAYYVDVKRKEEEAKAQRQALALVACMCVRVFVYALTHTHLHARARTRARKGTHARTLA